MLHNLDQIFALSFVLTHVKMFQNPFCVFFKLFFDKSLRRSVLECLVMQQMDADPTKLRLLSLLEHQSLCRLVNHMVRYNSLDFVFSIGHQK
jgi:hypothetical protein